MKMMLSRYPGTCRACGERFGAGSPIFWYGRGQAEHNTAECHPPGEDDLAEVEEFTRYRGQPAKKEEQA